MTNHFDFNRLKVLYDYDILDTKPEVMFDEITNMASIVCNSPIALISVLDDKTQLVKSNYGMQLIHIPVASSICAVAISEGKDFFSVENIQQDPRFSNNPFLKSFPEIVSYNAVLLKASDETPFGTLCVISDKLKKLSAKQRAFLQLLSKQIVRLLEMKKMNALMMDYQNKMQSYTNRIEEFASMAAHDLKSPTRNIKSFLELLKMRHESYWDAEDLEYFQFIETSIHKMNALVSALLEYSKADIGEQITSIIAIEKKIKTIFENQIKLFNQPNAKLVLKDIQPITSIPIVIEVVFENLINNALKYQEINNSARIEILQEETPKEYVFRVCDNGIGIDPKFKDHIFEPFKRLHNDRVYKGSGLGLATCSRMLKNIGGSIAVAPNTNVGSCFTVKIPKYLEV